MAEPMTRDILASIKDQMVCMDRRFSAVDAQLAEFKADVHGDFKAINARLDEQRQTINALIPTRIAAVPPAAE
mgnify:CR=1 FL=1